MSELNVGEWACSLGDTRDPDKDSRAHLLEHIGTEPQEDVEGLWVDFACSRVLSADPEDCQAYKAVPAPEDMTKCEECLVIQDLESWLTNLDECTAAGDSRAILSSVSWQDKADRLRKAVRVLRQEHKLPSWEAVPAGECARDVSAFQEVLNRRATMGQLFTSVVEWLRENEWSPHVLQVEGKADKATLRVFGSNGNWECSVVDRGEYLAVFRSVLPVYAPRSAFPVVSEFLHRANWGLSSACFQIDFSDGEIRCETAYYLVDAGPSPALIEHFFSSNVYWTDTYLPGLMAVLYGGKTPEQAIDECEPREEDEEDVADDEGEKPIAEPGDD